MNDYSDYIAGKTITIMGLAAEGRGIQDALWCLEHGAKVRVTDLKAKEELGSALERLTKYESVEYILGEHRTEDFTDVDMVIRSASAPLGSPYLKAAREAGVDVHTDESLFFELLRRKGVSLTTIGVTGTRGKTTVTMLIHHILCRALPKVHLAGNIRGTATLPLIEKVKNSDYMVMELDSWKLQGLGEHDWSPDLAVFTNFMEDHQNYYGSMQTYFDDKANIFKYQVEGNYLVVSKGAYDAIGEYYEGDIPSTLALATPAMRVPKDWKLPLLGEHNRENIALAVQVAEILKIPPRAIREGVESFEGVEGRLQYVGEIQGRKVYNDNNATTPEATVAALKALSGSGPITLIVGGADKKIDTIGLVGAIVQYVENVVLIPGTGTDALRFKLYERVGHERVFDEEKTFNDIVRKAFEISKEGGVVLLSPGFASFGMFANEYDRNDQFLSIVRDLKKTNL